MVYLFATALVSLLSVCSAVGNPYVDIEQRYRKNLEMPVGEKIMTEAEDEWFRNTNGQRSGFQNSWNGDKNDFFPEIVNKSKKFIHIGKIDYNSSIVNEETGEFVGKQPWFIAFVNPSHYESNI